MLTVLMATYNGAVTLSETLEAFCQLEEPVGGWKLVIVDNGSTDHTQEIIQSYCERLPVTILYEPLRGKNIALNRGLNSVSGDLVVFTDDDVLPQPGWLVQIRAAVEAHPEISVFGGAILPKWSVPPEDWLQDLEWPYMGGSFALVQPTFTEGPIDPDNIVGPNMAIRSELFEAGHQFDVTIGPDGTGSYPMGSETEFVTRMAKQGYKLWHCKQAVVYHIIRPHQMHRAWILARAVRFGRGMYRKWAKHALNSPPWVKIPCYIARQVIILAQLFRQAVRLMIASKSNDPDKLFRQQWWWNYYLGKALESRAIGLKR
ncbi:MAG: glycosyltransferase family 2 protein [Anaerolineae bacterium]|nr:glycosyltransferase family 2 protein [Anaerolineae bacterium]